MATDHETLVRTPEAIKCFSGNNLTLKMTGHGFEEYPHLFTRVSVRGPWPQARDPHTVLELFRVGTLRIMNVRGIACTLEAGDHAAAVQGGLTIVLPPAIVAELDPEDVPNVHVACREGDRDGMIRPCHAYLSPDFGHIQIHPYKVMMGPVALTHITGYPNVFAPADGTQFLMYGFTLKWTTPHLYSGNYSTAHQYPDWDPVL